MKASVIIPARDAAATLPATLDALPDGIEVIVVDDGSTDATRALAERHPHVTRVVDAPGTGPGGARNVGAQAATGDALVFLDADCVPVAEWLDAGLAALADADLVQGRVDPDPRAPIGPFDRTLSVTAAWGLFESANLFVRRDAFERIGGFEDWLRAPDERLLGETVRAKGLAEDVWFGWSARRAGHRTAFAAGALVHHAVFERSATAYAAERLRLRHFPAIARRIPELRDTFFFARIFLSRRTAAFDAAATGAVLAVARRSPWPLLLALPYARIVSRTSTGWNERRARVAAVQVAADAVGATALARGSVAARSPVL